MVPNNFIPYIHDAYGGCLIFTGEGILKHFCIGCGLGFTKDPKMKCFAPPIRPTFSAGHQATGQDATGPQVGQISSCPFYGFLFRRKPFALLGRKKEKSVAKEQNEI